MTWHEYMRGRELAARDEPFYALVMAAMRRADDDNAALLRAAFPEVWDELQLRGTSAGGRLPGEALAPVPDEPDEAA